MKIFNDFAECLFSMKRISKIILKCGYTAWLLTYVAAGVAAAMYNRLFADFDTACYWFGELVSLGKEILGACAVPVFIFEILNLTLKK